MTILLKSTKCARFLSKLRFHAEHLLVTTAGIIYRPFAAFPECYHFADISKMIRGCLARILASFFCLFNDFGKIPPLLIAQ